MKSKIVRGIINGGVLAAVAALGITVYQLGTKPIAENPQEENSVQVRDRAGRGAFGRGKRRRCSSCRRWLAGCSTG